MRSTFRLLLIVLVLLNLSNSSFAWSGNEEKRREGKEGYAPKKKSNKPATVRTAAQLRNLDIQNERGRAASSVNEVDAMQRYIDYLSPSDLNRLPIGLKKKIGNSTIKIAISNAVFTPKYAELTVYAKVDIPQNNNSNTGSSTAGSKTIYFGIKGLKLSKDGGIIGDAKLVLLGDYKIPINGGNSSLTLKGDFNITTGTTSDSATYLKIDCNGFKELGLNANVEFPRSMLIPVDNNGSEIGGLVTGRIRNLIVSNWNDIIASFSLPKFQVKGVKGVSFDIETATIDLSDYRNSSDIVFPIGYKEKYLDKEPELMNLWRGVYAKQIRITLPKSFKDKTQSAPVSFGTQNLIIDNNGITGLFFAQNVLSLEKGSAGGWRFSVDSFRIAIEANRLLRAGFGGKVALPVNKDDSTYIHGYAQQDSTKRDSILRRKFLAYSAVISTSGEYLCRVVTRDSLSFDVWKGTVILKPNSYIELAGNSERFLPSAMLHGSMNIASNTSTSGSERLNKILDFKGIDFQGLHIQTVTPYLAADYFGYRGSISIGIIPVSIDSITLAKVNNSVDEIGLGFNLKVNLQDLNFGGKTRLLVIGKYQQDNGLSKWKYDRLKIEDISINAEIGSMKLSGGIAFLDNDPVYGDGFRGNLNLGIKLSKDSLKISSTAIFGNNGFRYWFVDGTAQYSGDGIPVGPALNVNGFGGGAYYRMKKDGYDAMYSQTGLRYIPDSTAGLGLRASIFFNIAKAKLDQGSASLEIAFNRNGGMRYIGIFGTLKVMTPLKIENLPGGNVFSSVKNMFKNIEDDVNGMLPAMKENAITKKILQPSAAANDMFQDSLSSSSFALDLSAILGINFDFQNKVFHANFDLFINTPGGIIAGVGPNGRAGWAVLHADQEKWYMHMGTPTDPIGLKIGLGPVSVQTTAYFMLGHDLPAFPDLPQPIRNLLGTQSIVKNINALERDSIAAGNGIAFGAGVRVATGDIKFLMLYANFQAGMGFDVMIKDFSNYTCSQTGRKPGINGWYAQGQVYAYLQGECGVRIKIGPIRKNIPIIKGAAVALLQTRMPSPTWVGGLFLIDVRLLGGAVKVKVNLKFSFGDQCDLLANGPEPDEINFDEFRVVQSITPSTGAQNISLFAKPQVFCTTKPEGAFVLPADEAGGADETYRPHIAAITFTKGSQTFGSKYKLSSDSSTLTLYPDSNFIAQTDYSLNVKVVYQKLVSGNWVTVTKEDGSPFEENTLTTFRTGNNPPVIPDENIGYMYPYKNQRFFYKNEVSTGRLLLNGSQNELFASFSSWRARFLLASSKQVIATTNVVYSSTAKSVNYPIPSELQASNAYILEIVGVEFNGGTLITDTSRPILQFNFNTSQYNTLVDKINALQATAPTPVVGRVESDVIDLQAKVIEYEGFDIAELMVGEWTGTKPLIKAEAILGDNYYYNSKIQPLINYPNFFSSQGITILRDTSAGYEIIPVNAVEVPGYYLNALTSSSYSAILYDRLPYTYNLNKVFNADYIDLRNRIVNQFMATLSGAPTNYPMYEWYRPCWLCSKKQRMTQVWVNYFNSPAYRQALSTSGIDKIPVNMRDIVTKPFPFMTKGDYKANFTIRKATGWDGNNNLVYEQSTPAVFTFHNPIESIFYNEWQSQTFTKTDCASGEDGGTVTYSIQPGTYSSTISQADANQKAINAINMYGQSYANQTGNCCVNGNCYVPGTVSVSLVSYLDCYGESFSITFSNANGVYYYDFPSGWYGSSIEVYLPAGTYNISFSGYGMSNPTFTLQNTWQSWYGVYETGTVVFSADTYYSFSVNSSCSNYPY